MNTFVDPNELTEAEANIYYWLILNPDKRKCTRAFIRQGGNRRQDHGSRGLHQGHTWDDRERDFSQSAKRRDFRAAGRQITGTM
ncbi:MAG TPA: hypothetical protein PLI45_04315 [Candidatus Woesebacteria bacterium]|nr:hypothetical protein [Candidatus Woesebacteria bacterium]